MADVFLTLLIISFACAVASLIKPSLFKPIFRSKANRGNLGYYFGIAIVVFFIAFSIASESKESSKENKQVAVKNEKKEEEATDKAVSNIPNDMEIINKQIDENASKVSIDIRLKQKVDKEQLKEIASYLKDTETERYYEKVFLTYYLPGMKINAGAWATSHFEGSNLNIEVYGATKEEEKNIAGRSEKEENVEIIGKWEDPVVGNLLIIYKEKGDFILEKVFESGTNKSELRKSGNKYIVEDNEFGEYYVINNDGSLGMYDDQGLIRNAIER